MDDLLRMYQWIKNTRTTLYEYLDQLTPGDFTREVSGFGHGSIRDTMVHTIDSYRFWISLYNREEHRPLSIRDCQSVTRLPRLFREIDEVMESLVRHNSGWLDEVVTRRIEGVDKPLRFSVRWLFAHMITHEFHHKGQVVSMGRALGYEPPDTDLSLPEL